MTFIRGNPNLSSTSYISGGVTTTASPTTVDITAGTALFMDHTVPTYPQAKLVDFGPFVGVTPIGLGGAVTTFFSVNVNGVLVQRVVPLDTFDVARTEVSLATVLHAGGVILSSFPVTVTPYSDIGNTIVDLYTSLGDLNIEGNAVSPNGSNLNFDKSAGITFALQRNALVAPTTPNKVSSPSVSPVTFTSSYRNGVGGFLSLAPTTTLDVANYDDGSGVLQPVAANAWVNHRVVHGSGVEIVLVLYGQNIYTGGTAALDAVSAITTEVHERDPIVGQQFETIGVISARGGAVDLSLTADAVFTATAKVRAV